MKRLVLFIVTSLSSCIAFAGASLLKVDIRDFGAKGDGETLNTSFINKAIHTCSEQGGGTVVIPRGTFFTGTIVLQSNITLYLQEGAILKGVDDLTEYQTILSYNTDTTYYMVKSRNWNKALILGDKVNNVMVTGEGIIDGGHIEDKGGEEGMRGPHILFLSRSSNITVSGIRIIRASNYAFMSYDIRNILFSNITMEEGWDGIHIRGGKNIQIRNCRFYTGDDAVAGGGWENLIMDNCYLNSSCNGIRIIMPVSDMEIRNCDFQGPGRYPHRTSGEIMRRNMLTGIMIQPGGWFEAPGNIEKVRISGCSFDNLDNPFQFILNKGNDAVEIYMEHITGKRLLQAAGSIESWNGGCFSNVYISDMTLEYTGKDEKSLLDIVPAKPQTDYRQLPCWGLFLRNVHNLELKNVKLSYTGKEIRPVFYMDNVANSLFEDVSYSSSNASEAIIRKNSGLLKMKP